MNFFDEIIDNVLDEDQAGSSTSVPKQLIRSSDKIQSSIADMLFANGDAANPKPECVAFMKKLLKEQILLVLNQANDYAIVKGHKNVKLEDLLQCVYQYPNFVCRLVEYIRNRLTLSPFNTAFNEASDDETENVHEKKHRDIPKLCSILKKLDKDKILTDLVKQALKPDYVDEIKQKRQARISQFTEQMDAETYVLFTKARRRCLCYNYERHVSKAFLDWIGIFKMDTCSMLTLNFLASEIIAQMVESALLVREHDSTEPPTNLHENPLDITHYKNALRRNLGYQTKRNLVFGYMPVKKTD